MARYMILDVEYLCSPNVYCRHCEAEIEETEEGSNVWGETLPTFADRRFECVSEDGHDPYPKTLPSEDGYGPKSFRLGWLAPTLEDYPIQLTEDGLSEYVGEGFATYHRKWAGIITEAKWNELASDWSLEPSDSEPNMGILTEYGWMPSDSWNLEGMDWNVGGSTPIAFASVRISPPYTFG